MPSPVGHALGGLVIGLVLGPRSLGPQSPAPGSGRAGTERASRASSDSQPDPGVNSRPDPRVLWLCVLAACLPDLDFAWGRHSMETHGLGFVVAVGAAVLAWKRSPHLALACALAAGTHVLFDWLGSDDFPPLGVMALWPFSREFYFADAYVFATISRRYWLPGFVMHNVAAVLREVAILLPMVAIAYSWRRRRAL